MDAQVPGGVYLCQVSDKVSCGACCGLYNVADTSREQMEKMLLDRTRRFAQVPRTTAGIDAFAEENQRLECQQRPFPQFHHCPFIGLIGKGGERVGCLLHPMAEGNQGVDFRGLSFYGGLACRTYFCPSTHSLPPRYKRVLRMALADWHLYGLVVTETDLISALFHQIEVRLTQHMEPTLFINRPEAVQALNRLLELKLSWPHRPLEADTPCHHFFFDVNYAKPLIDYRRLGVAPSHYNPVLRELISAFDSVDALRRAEQGIDQAIAGVVTALL